MGMAAMIHTTLSTSAAMATTSTIPAPRKAAISAFFDFISVTSYFAATLTLATAYRPQVPLPVFRE